MSASAEKTAGRAFPTKCGRLVLAALIVAGLAAGGCSDDKATSKVPPAGQDGS